MPIKTDYAGIKTGSLDYREILNKQNPTIVQIGAHDGIVGEEYGLQETLDIIDNFSLFLVEPIISYFGNLSNVYGKYGSRVKYTNCAITDSDGICKMVDRGGMSHINESGNILVQSKTWNTFITESKITQIDLLLIDCEGYEFDILKQINFDNPEKPKIIRYEYTHIPNKQECDNFLKSKGYKIEYCYHDHSNNKVAF